MVLIINFLICLVIVLYGKEVGGLGISVEHELDRCSILKELKRKGRKVDDTIPYQPEEDGWKVTQVKIGA